VRAGAHSTDVNALPPPFTTTTTLTQWTLDVPAVAVSLGLGVLYVLAARRRRSWPPGRTVSFLLGLVTVLLATCSSIGVYAGALFWARAVQNTVLLMVTPLLLALGAPVTLLMSSVPPPIAARLRSAGRSRSARAATFPLAVTVLLIAPPFLVYCTGLYEATLREAAVGGVVRFALVLAGFVYFWTRIQLDPTPREDPHLVSVWIALTEVVFDGVLGLVLWLGPLVAPGYYHELARAWGPDQRLDQIIGAGVLWIGGDIAGLPFVAALFVRWARDDERRAERIDRELDEHPETTAGLWWENDPLLAERFRRQGR
jgi:cytochrome c oxidase assembly factor CtaG